jgi:hypothetical protein
MAARIEPTAEQLAQAWQHRRRAHWPATLQATLAVPMLAALVRADAVRRALALRRRTTLPTTLASSRPGTTGRPAGNVPHPCRLPAFDHKRAAAGDLDD